MRINGKYLRTYSGFENAGDFNEDPARSINYALADLGESLEEGVNFEMSYHVIDEEDHPLNGDVHLKLSCVVLTPEVFRKMVEKIDYYDPYFMDMILADLSTIEHHGEI